MGWAWRIGDMVVRIGEKAGIWSKRGDNPGPKDWVSKGTMDVDIDPRV